MTLLAKKYLFGQYQYFRGAGQHCRVRRDWGGRVDRKNTGRGHGTFHILHARQRGMEGRGAPDVGNLGSGQGGSQFRRRSKLGTIYLIRAVARVDVGLKLSDTSEGGFHV